MTESTRWRQIEVRQAAKDDPLVLSGVVPSGVGPLVAQLVPSEAQSAIVDSQAADVALKADLVFHLTEPEL